MDRHLDVRRAECRQTGRKAQGHRLVDVGGGAGDRHWPRVHLEEARQDTRLTFDRYHDGLDGDRRHLEAAGRRSGHDRVHRQRLRTQLAANEDLHADAGRLDPDRSHRFPTRVDGDEVDRLVDGDAGRIDADPRDSLRQRGEVVRQADQLQQQSEHLLAVEVTCSKPTDLTAKRNLTGVFQHWDLIDPEWNPGGIWQPVTIPKLHSPGRSKRSSSHSRTTSSTTEAAGEAAYNPAF